MIKVLFSGDFCSQAPHKIKLGENLKSLLSSADICQTNFEGILEVGEPVTSNKNRLHQSFEAPNWLENNGFNLISLANNHAYDFGIDGLQATIDSFTKTQLVGVGKWQNAYKVVVKEIGGIRIGFLSATHADFSSLKDFWTDKNKLGCAWINHCEFDKLILNSKSICDYLFVLPHAGAEYMSVPLPEWRDRYRYFIELGADAVIASHPHVPQGYEIYNGKYIFYSLGNFFFDWFLSASVPQNWNNGLVVLLTIEDEIKVNVYPVLKQDDYIEVDDTIESYSYLNYLCNLIKDEISYLEVVNSECLRLYSKYLGWTMASLRVKELPTTFISWLKLLKACFMYDKVNLRSALHQFRSEDNRFIISRAFKILSETNL